MDSREFNHIDHTLTSMDVQEAIYQWLERKIGKPKHGALRNLARGSFASDIVISDTREIRDDGK